MQKYSKINVFYKDGFLTMEKDTNFVIDMVKNKKGVFERVEQVEKVVSWKMCVKNFFQNFFKI